MKNNDHTTASNRRNRWNLAAGGLLSVLLLTGMARLGAAVNGVSAVENPDTIQSANIVDDIEDMLEDIIRILNGGSEKPGSGDNDGEDEPAAGS